MSKHVIGLVASGAMGSAIARRLVTNGYTVLTSLAGRSEGSVLRAAKAGMQDVGMKAMIQKSQYILSIVPPSNAGSFADEVLACLANKTDRQTARQLVFVDCNAISPAAVAQLASKFEQYNQTQPTTTVNFVDASIIGGPPSPPGSERVYNPTFYVSGEKLGVDDVVALMRDGGLKATALEDAGVGEASALKMGYAGINKGLTGLTAAMILGESSLLCSSAKTEMNDVVKATYASSPATAKALMTELASSQPVLLQRTVRMIPDMLPKAYRFVGEMHEIADFTSSSLTSLDAVNGGQAGDTWRGLAGLFELVSTSLKTDGESHKILEGFVKDAKEVLNTQ